MTITWESFESTPEIVRFFITVNIDLKVRPYYYKLNFIVACLQVYIIMHAVIENI